MRYLFLGDTHGDLSFASRACEFARDNGVDEIIQVGDWGYLWPGKDKIGSLDSILKHYAVPMRFIDGNHDDHPNLRTKSERTPRITYQPRGSLHVDADGTAFLFLGGAPSIDRGWRTPGKSWWPEETITAEEAARAHEHARADVVVTHDAPDYPVGFSPAGSPEFRQQSAESMAIVRGLVERYSPKLHVHGHWHHWYRSGVTVGLDCNTGHFSNAVLLWGAS